VKLGALGFVLLLDKQNALNFQLLGGIWILQTFPTIVFGLFTRWFNKWALLAGWAVGMVYGTATAYNVVNPATGRHFGGSITKIPFFGTTTGYIGLTAFALNAVIATALTLILRAAMVRDRGGETTAADYFVDRADAESVENAGGRIQEAGPSTGDTGSATAPAR